MGISVNTDFLQAASTFLNCEIGAPSFSFLCILVRVNPRRKDVWRPIVSKIRIRLSSWKNKKLSMGGRVVLLNFILTKYSNLFLLVLQGTERNCERNNYFPTSFFMGRCGREEKDQLGWLECYLSA